MFVGLFILFQHWNRVLIWMIVNQLMTLGAEQHQITDIVYIGGPDCGLAARAPFTERDDMGHLGEISRREG